MSDFVVSENPANGKASRSLLRYRDPDAAIENVSATREDIVSHTIAALTQEQANDRDAATEKAFLDSSACESVEDSTNQGDANLLAARHAGRLAHCPEIGWLAWNGKHWETSAAAEGQAGNMVAETMYAKQQELDAEAARLTEAARIAAEAGELTPAMREQLKLVKASAKWAHDGKNTSRIDSTLSRARAHHLIATKHDLFDANRWLITVPNGTIDLRTMKLLDHDPAHRITQMIPIEYDLGARCPTFDKFLESSVPNKEHRDFLIRYLGYCLTGSDREHVMLLMLGEGRNGKGTLMETIRKIFGGYSAAAKGSSFLKVKHESGGGAASPDVARWRGKRLLAVSELRADAELNESFVKSITGGDTIAARALYRDEFEFSPHFKIVWSLNDKPKISGNDYAIWERLVLMPWEVTFTNPDKTLKERLELELPGIFRKLLMGCREWIYDGLKIPESMKAAKNTWRDEENIVQDFFDECYALNDRVDNARIDAKSFRAQMEQWCRRNGRTTPTAQNIGRSVAKMPGVTVKPSNGKTWYYGIEARQDIHLGGWAS